MARHALLTPGRDIALQRRESSAGMATLAALMTLLLLMGMVALLGARVLQSEQMGSEALVQGHQRQSLKESGLDWGLRLLNSPMLDRDCHPGTGGGPAFAEGLTHVDERGHRRVREPWQGRPFVCSADEGRWRCHCPDRTGAGLPSGADPDHPARFSDQLPRFSLEFQGQERADASAWHRRTLRLLAQSCAEAQSSCELPGTPASSPLPERGQAQLVVLSSALAQAPGSALVSASSVDLHGMDGSHAGIVLPPDPDSAWVLQAGGDVLGAHAHVQGPPGSPPEHWIRRLEPELVLEPDGFFKRFFGMSPAQYRQRAGLSMLDCRALSDCSTAVEARVSAGQRWLWMQGPVRLRRPLRLGSLDSPVLLLSDSDLDIDAALQLTGLLYSHGSTRLRSTDASLRIEGALLSAGPCRLTGQVQVIHGASIVRRLAELRGSWVRLPGGWAP
ncbi:MAG TPA: hypothetical protein VK195_01065 [Burkholderiaceae bacterium]|nr:hypothetical protein [Burkholderiaceae bacterium]